MTPDPELVAQIRPSERRRGSRGYGRQRSPAPALTDEAYAINEVTGAKSPLILTSVVLAAWRGQETRALELIGASIQDADPSGEGRALALAEYAKAVLYNGLRRYQAALVAAVLACENEDMRLSTWSLPELVEASARSGKLDLAAAGLRSAGGYYRPHRPT